MIRKSEKLVCAYFLFVSEKFVDNFKVCDLLFTAQEILDKTNEIFEENIKSKQKLRESIIDWLFQSSWKDSNWTQFVEIYRNNKDKVLLWEWNGGTVVEEEEDIPEWNL